MLCRAHNTFSFFLFVLYIYIYIIVDIVNYLLFKVCFCWNYVLFCFKNFTRLIIILLLIIINANKVIEIY